MEDFYLFNIYYISYLRRLWPYFDLVSFSRYLAEPQKFWSDKTEYQEKNEYINLY